MIMKVPCQVDILNVLTGTYLLFSVEKEDFGCTTLFEDFVNGLQFTPIKFSLHNNA